MPGSRKCRHQEIPTCSLFVVSSEARRSHSGNCLASPTSTWGQTPGSPSRPVLAWWGGDASSVRSSEARQLTKTSKTVIPSEVRPSRTKSRDPLTVKTTTVIKRHSYQSRAILNFSPTNPPQYPHHNLILLRKNGPQIHHHPIVLHTRHNRTIRLPQPRQQLICTQ